MMRSLAALSLLLLPVAAQEPPPRPRLVVLCAVDQLASWVFEAGKPFVAADGGFARLMHDGTQFTSCAYEHACTETAPGHATIGTGVPARVHGIVRNRWWRPERGKAVMAIDEEVEPLADLPEGKNRGPGALLVPTFATALKAHVPGSRAGSVSWKDRSAILMGGRGSDVAMWFEPSTGRFVTNTVWCKETPPWLVQLNESKPLDAFFGWQWTKLGPDAAYEGLVDDRPYENQLVKNGRTLPQTITGTREEPDASFYNRAYMTPVGNTLVRVAAEAMVRGLGLGTDAAPDLLCMSFSSTDAIGHAFGPDSVESRDALLRLDRELATFFTFLDGVAGKGNWALFLTADHGVQPTPEWARQHGVDAQRVPTLGRQVESAAKAVLAERFGPPPEGKQYLVHTGEYGCELDHALLATAGNVADAPLVAARLVAAKLRTVRGVFAAYATADLLAMPHPDAMQRSLIAALQPERCGDVFYVLQPYWQDSPVPASHGTPHPYDREVAAFAIGPGVPAGVRIGQPITPGFGVVLFAKMLGIPEPNEAPDTLPSGFLGIR